MSHSNNFSSAWDLGGVEKRGSNFGRRLSASEVCLDSSGNSRMESFTSLLRPSTNSIDSDASGISTFRVTSADLDLSSLDSLMGMNSDDFTSHKSSLVTNPADLNSRKEGSPDEGKDKEKLLYALKRFNLDAGKGLKLLEERGFLAMTPDSVAHFLFHQERLSKKQIGIVIGGHKEFNKSVLQSFARLHQFKKVTLVQALRQFLWNFR